MIIIDRKFLYIEVASKDDNMFTKSDQGLWNASPFRSIFFFVLSGNNYKVIKRRSIGDGIVLRHPLFLFGFVVNLWTPSHILTSSDQTRHTLSSSKVDQSDSDWPTSRIFPLFMQFIQVLVSPQLVVNSVWTCDGVMAFAHIISVFIFIRVFCRCVTMPTVWIATRNNLSCCVTTVTSAFTVATTWARTCVSTSSKKVNNF